MSSLRKPSNSWKDKDIIVGRFIKPDGRCKKHPKHRQSPGVCSLCLRDKLVQVQLSAASTSKTTTSATAASSGSSSASSLSSYYSSSSGSSCASPSLYNHNHTNFPLTTEGKRSSSVSLFLLSSKHGLVKSRSMAAVIPRREENGVDDHNNNNSKSGKKIGFWSKLLLLPRNKRSMEEKDPKVVVRSSSLREAMTVTS